MKSVHHKFADRESREKLPSVGKSFYPEKNYTKDDFLTPGKVGEKFGISTEKAKDLMKSLNRKGSSFVLNDHMSKIVVTLGKSYLYLHPMATEAFQKYLDNQKVK